MNLKLLICLNRYIPVLLENGGTGISKLASESGNT